MAGEPKIGVLALQGDFEAHSAALVSAGARPFLVRKPAGLAEADGLCLPGGESTTMLNFLAEGGFFEALRAAAAEKPVYATCAGMILLSKEVTSPAQPSFGLLDVTVERNGFGRQVASFIGEVDAPALGAPLEAVFIRAPRIRRVGDGVEVLGRLPDGEPVLVRERNVLAASFHPELSRDDRVARLFLSRVPVAR